MSGALASLPAVSEPISGEIGSCQNSDSRRYAFSTIVVNWTKEKCQSQKLQSSRLLSGLFPPFCYGRGRRQGQLHGGACHRLTFGTRRVSEEKPVLIFSSLTRFIAAHFACCIPKGFKPLAGGKLAPPPENDINPFDIPERLQYSVAVIPPG